MRRDGTVLDNEKCIQCGLFLWDSWAWLNVGSSADSAPPSPLCAQCVPFDRVLSTMRMQGFTRVHQLFKEACVSPQTLLDTREEHYHDLFDEDIGCCRDVVTRIVRCIYSEMQMTSFMANHVYP